MKEVTLRIPEKRLSFFIELIKQLGFEITSESDIPEEHKNTVRKRIKSATPEDIVPWEDARSQFRFKDGE